MKLSNPFNLLGLATVSVALSGCLDRPVGVEQPRTTNVLVDTLVQSAVDKIDLLFVVDNSISMADKQAIMALAVPDLVRRLVSPVCVEGDMVVEEPASSKDICTRGAREFNPINDIHIGIVTSSLGGYGAQLDCSGQGNADAVQSIDMAELLGSLPRGSTAAPSAGATGFLSWTATSDVTAFGDEFTNLVKSAGEYGCGWEATLESWFRFLVDPYPYTKIVRKACNASDTANSCAGPETMPGTETPMLNQKILDQRKQFLRPDSLLAIVMLTDENDCSFKASGQTWRLSQSAQADASGALAYYPAFRGTAACSNPEMGPNHKCCHSCGQATVPDGCPTMPDAMGAAAAVGCEAGRKFTIDETGDHPNLRCYDQKRRFGVDYLYPTVRYSNALKQHSVCPPLSSDTVAVDGCQYDPAPNPIFADLDDDPTPAVPRPQGLIFLAGILGVPWQDIAVDPNAPTLKYRVNRPDADAMDLIDWNLILGPDVEPGVPRQPADPLMRESVTPRTGTNPATGEALAPPGSGYMANKINGHEWTIKDESDLQYACIFPVADNKCITKADAEAKRDNGESVSNCDCTDYPGDEWGNPLCQAQGDAFDDTQRHAKAYPGLRELEVLKAYGANSIVASICPKSVDDAGAADYGYRPAVRAIVDRLKEQLADQCLTRSLSIKEGDKGPEAACKIIEAKRLGPGETANCEAARARTPVEEAIDQIARRELEEKNQCKKGECDKSQFQLCTITQITSGTNPDAYESCLNKLEAPKGDGWCYVDPAKGLGSNDLVAKCPETARRKLRFVGLGTPETNTVTLYACAGEAFVDPPPAADDMK